MIIFVLRLNNTVYQRFTLFIDKDKYMDFIQGIINARINSLYSRAMSGS